MVPITSSETERLASVLSKYSLRSAVSRIAGLLTAPELVANTLRLELLVHLIVAHCRGTEKADEKTITKWLNKYLGETTISRLEDPPEDVFVTNVSVPEGNGLLFEGTWSSNDFYLQLVLETLQGPGVPSECSELLRASVALVKLSHTVAKRLQLRRWTSADSAAQGFIHVTRSKRVSERSRAVFFTDKDLSAMSVDRRLLAPFILAEAERDSVKSETIGNTSLERKPIIAFEDGLVLALPHAVSPAIRSFIIVELAGLGYLPAFRRALTTLVARQIEDEVLHEIKEAGEPLDLSTIERPQNLPSLHSWCARFDGDKCVHILLLSDEFENFADGGLVGLVKIAPSKIRAVETFISEVAKIGLASGIASGITLVVLSGLGRGWQVEFETWPENWKLSVINAPSLLTIVRRRDGPLQKFLKMIWQKEAMEEAGVAFLHMNGDFALYSYWRHVGYQLNATRSARWSKFWLDCAI